MEKSRQLVKVCNMYYIDGLSQQEIAQKLFISRSQISRMIKRARDAGIVKISITNPFSEEQKYEKWLTETFGLIDALVVDVPSDAAAERDQQLSKVTTELLDVILESNSIFGVSAGTSVNAVSLGCGQLDRPGVLVVPIVGGISAEGVWQANLNAQNFSDRLGAHCLQLNAPVIVAEELTRNALMAEPAISSVLAQARRASVALIGMGQISSTATMREPRFLNETEYDELVSKGAQTSVCNTFLDKEGKCIDFSAYSRMIGLIDEDLRRIPKVVGLAYGEQKVPAITAALRGRWINIMITTLDTARSIHDYYFNSLLN